MIIIAGKCPNCNEWDDKVIHRSISIAPTTFETTCQKCGGKVWIETLWASQKIIGKFFRRTQDGIVKGVPTNGELDR